MALQLVMGNPGSGKSHYIFEKIIQEAMECPKKQFLVIVPEQFTMQTQKDLVMMHPRHGIMNIDVLSFERLAHRVFDEVGGEHRKILEDTGKNLVLRRLAEEKKDELVLLGGNLHRLGYISEVKSLLSEFTQYRIGPEQLARIIEQNKNNPQLSFKLKDMKVIYEGFRQYLSDTYLTAEELLDALAGAVERSGTVRGSVIVLDGYTGFTPVQMNLLKKLLALAEDVYVTLTMDGQEKPFTPAAEYQLFYLTRKTASALSKLAEETGAGMRPPVICKDAGKYRFREAKALHFLETHIFRHQKEVWEEDTEELHLYTARTPRAESEMIGREIQRLVRDEGLRYRDMAVVTGDLDLYGTLLEEAFAGYGIPGFMDRKRDVLKNPFVEFLRALLSAVQEDFTYESMFRLLRSGMLPVSMEETDRLENYVVARGIRGYSGWNREWKRPLKGMDEEGLAALNLLREQAFSGIPKLRKALRKKGQDVGGISTAIYEYLTGLKVQEQLKEYEERFEAQGDHSRAREYAQIYGMAMELFDKFVMLLGESRMDLAEYAELLDAGLSEMKVGLIPAGTDQVVVGDMERSRLKDIKVLFFAGVNEGIVPGNKSRGGILSELERELLLEQQVELAPTSRQEACIQKFYIYLNLARPSGRLYLTWSQADADGNALRPSWLVGQVQKLFPRTPVQAEAQKDQTERLVLPSGSIGDLTDALKNARMQCADERERALVKWYGQQEEWQRKLARLMDAVCFTNQEDEIGQAVAHALYGTILQGSVTRLEQFAACAYAHFLQYGLRLTERETYGLEAIDMGNVFHAALKYFSDTVEKSGYGWFHVPDKERDAWMEEALTRAMEDYADQALSGRAQDTYVLERVRRIGKRTAWAVLKQLKKGMFLPEETEVSFRDLEHLKSVTVHLSDADRMCLQGRIDRIDVCKEEDQVYVRVIDYKSGSSRFDLTSIYYGLQLQLVVYLNAAMEMQARRQGKDVRPAGMFYYHIEDPMLAWQDGLDIEGQMMKELRWNGLVNADREIILKMDREADAGSDILPVRIKADNNYTLASSVAKEPQFFRLAGHVQKKIAEYGRRILQGDIRLRPYELGDEDACRYCPYHSVCGFDRKIEGCEKRRLRPMDSEEIWKRIEEDAQKP